MTDDGVPVTFRIEGRVEMLDLKVHIPQGLDRVDGECYAKDCRAGAKPNMLMCWGHWKRVPRVIQQAVWQSNYLAHPDYEASRRAARAAVGVKDGLPPEGDEVDLLARFRIGLDGYPLP